MVEFPLGKEKITLNKPKQVPTVDGLISMIPTPMNVQTFAMEDRRRPWPH